MKKGVILMMLALVSITAAGQEWWPEYEKVTADENGSYNTWLQGTDDGTLIYVGEDSYVGYVRTIKAVLQVASDAGLGVVPDQDRSIVPSTVEDITSDYCELAVSMGQAEIVQVWYTEDYAILLVLNSDNYFATISPLEEDE